MFGEDVGNLTLFKQLESDGETKTPVWKRSGTQGEKWRKASVQAPAGEPFHMYIDGSVGETKLGNIAIDDIVVAQQACPVDQAVKCDFETDMCSFSNKGDVDWQRIKANANKNLHDHTTGTSEGSLMKLVMKGEEKGILEGGLHSGGRKACVQAFYLTHSPVDAFINVYVKKIEDDFNVAIGQWNIKGTGWRWKLLSLSVDTEGDYLETDQFVVMFIFTK